MPFPSLGPPVTLLVDGKRRVLVVCLVLDVTPPGLDSPVWFSAGNGSALDAFTYSLAPSTDGTWTSMVQLSLPAEDLEAWEPVVCHTGAGAGGPRRSTRPLRLSGAAPLPATPRGVVREGGGSRCPSKVAREGGVWLRAIRPRLPR